MDNQLPISIVEGFPWCSGTFQNRSLPSGSTIITPVFGSGLQKLISGKRFVASETGRWMLYVGSSRFNLAVDSSTAILLNSEDDTTGWTGRVVDVTGTAGGRSTSSLYGTHQLQHSEYLCVLLSIPASSVTTFNDNNSVLRYFFARIL